ncbi:MAG: Protein of unknown function (DUF2634) [Candidatus Frackibacter sp. T328-2]|jgi:hypothetical protein|nr:MAG: Protein of unknown function (DUF2634) [Candidatus Frackibacter sp. T328-2]
MSVFPFIDGLVNGEEFEEEELPLYKEFDWNFNENKFKLVDGKFVVVEGKDALKIYIYKALITVKNRYKIYSDEYGSDLEKLIGKGFTNGFIRSQVRRYIKESLLINPYIESINNFILDFEDDLLKISLNIGTIYGEVSIDV